MRRKKGSSEMKVNNEPIVVNYQKKPTECRCCGRAFDGDESNLSSIKEFEVTVSGFFECSDWTNNERLKKMFHSMKPLKVRFSDC